MSELLNYNQSPTSTIDVEGEKIYCFDILDGNIDSVTVESFGEEWSKFDSFSNDEINVIGNEYFDIIDKTMLNQKSSVLDVGCGTGRWSLYWSDKVKNIEAIDPSMAVISAVKLTKEAKNIRVSKASVDNIPFDDNSFDFVMSIGVLHHIPDTKEALRRITEKCKKGGHVYIYLYYSLDNRGFVYKLLFKFSNIVRFFVSNLPSQLKKIVCDLIAIFVYMSFISIAYFLKVTWPKSNLWTKVPLSYYVNKSFNVIRNDALDRFGTPLEHRFSRDEVIQMMEAVGLSDINVSPRFPYWHAVGRK